MNYAIVLAGGSGKRMNSKVKKQYIELNGKPLLYYTLKAFEDSLVDKIIVVAGREDFSFINDNIVSKYNITKVENIVEGGEQRYNSVYNGLKFINEADIVLIHDGARPFVNTTLINEMIDATELEKATIAAVKVKDTIKTSTGDQCVGDTIPRDNLWQIQTPQAFVYYDIKNAYDKLFNDNMCEGITDDAMVWEKIYPERSVKIIESDYLNIKVTTPEDLVFGAAILEKKGF